MSNLRPALSKHLSRTIILLAIPLFIVSLTVFYHYANTFIHNEAVHRSTTILNTTVQLVDNYLSTIETAAKSNAWMIEENFTPDSIEAISHRIVRLNGSVLSCSVSTEPDIFPEYGKYFSVYSVNGGDTVITVKEPEFEYFEKNWYKKPMQMGRPCWINPFSDFNAGTINHHDAVGSYCIPLRPQGGRIAGVISVDFSFKRLRETILATHHPYPSSYYMILGPAGGYLVHPESSLLFKNTIFSATDSVAHPDVIKLGREMTAGHHGTMHVTFDKDVCHVCYEPIADTGWSIALVCNDDDVLEDYNHLIIVMIVIIIIGMLFILWLTRRVVQSNIGPINELMEATNEIAKGNYDNILPPSNHKDVVGKLQNAFRKMQLAILKHAKNTKETSEEIEKESAELEKTLSLANEIQERKLTFIHNISSQINAPINVIKGLVNVLKTNIAMRSSTSSDEPMNIAEINKITKELKRNAAYLERMTLMLYDSSDTGAANKSRYDRKDNVSCNEVAQDSIKATKQYYGVKEIRFETELPDNFRIKTNRLYVDYSLRELLLNAKKYSDKKHIALRVTQTETTVRFIVEDVGPGLHGKNIEELAFVPFAKVDDLSEGLGLGLPLCKSHAEALGGTIIHDTDYQEGCRIIFELPKKGNSEE